jgi:hypothetical protein
MSENNVKELVRRKSSPLPVTLSENTLRRSTNDLVQIVFAELYPESSDFRDLLQAVWNEESVEGNINADDIMASAMIRNRAKQSMDSEVREKIGVANVVTIAHSLKVVMRRYKLGRLQRRYLLEGEEVEPGPEDEQL